MGQIVFCGTNNIVLLVREAGFEPAAYRLGGGRSIHLSYKRKMGKFIIISQLVSMLLFSCSRLLLLYRYLRKHFESF